MKNSWVGWSFIILVFLSGCTNTPGQGSEIIRNEAIDGTIDLETYFIEATKGREAHHD